MQLRGMFGMGQGFGPGLVLDNCLSLLEQDDDMFLPVMMTDLFYMYDVLLGENTEIVYVRGGTSGTPRHRVGDSVQDGRSVR